MKAKKMIDFKKAIREGVPPTQDKIDAARLDAEKKLSRFKEKIYWSLGLVLSAPIFLIVDANSIGTAFFACAAVAVVVAALITALDKVSGELKKRISLYTEYSGVANLCALKTLKKKHICGKVYLKALGEMGRTITKGEVEAIESQIKETSLSELKEEVYR